GPSRRRGSDRAARAPRQGHRAPDARRHRAAPRAAGGLHRGRPRRRAAARAVDDLAAPQAAQGGGAHPRRGRRPARLLLRGARRGRAAQGARGGAVMGVFERSLSLWVALAIAAGVGLGLAAPGLFEAVARLEWARVNLVVAALI